MLQIKPISIDDFYTQAKRANRLVILHELPGSHVGAWVCGCFHIDIDCVTGILRDGRLQIEPVRSPHLQFGAADKYDIHLMLAPGVITDVRNRPTPDEISIDLGRIQSPGRIIGHRAAIIHGNGCGCAGDKSGCWRGSGRQGGRGRIGVFWQCKSWHQSPSGPD